MKTIISIDCGTQSLRASLSSPEGEMLGIQRILFDPCVSRQPGWAEQDPEIYWQALTTACNKLKAENPEYFENIAGVGVTTMRDSLVNVDEQGNALRPLMVWLDQRKAAPVY